MENTELMDGLREARELLAERVSVLLAWKAVKALDEVLRRMDGEKAEGQRLPEGESDYYHFGAYQLRLHADAQGVLRSLIIQ